MSTSGAGRARRTSAARVAVLVGVLGGALAPGACDAEPEPEATVEVGDAVFVVELATSVAEQKEGLAGRTDVPAGTGMLFPFPERAEHQMWMAGMEVPVDVAWIDGDRVVGVVTLVPCTEHDQTTCPRWTAPAPATALLEVPAGALRDVDPGDEIEVRETA